MEIEEIRKLSNEDLGKRLAQLLGLEVKTVFAGSAHYKRPSVGKWSNVAKICLLLDSVAEIERLVIKTGLATTYARDLCLVIEPLLTFPKGTPQDFDFAIYAKHVWRVATATPRQRAEACYLTLLSCSAPLR